MKGKLLSFIIRWLAGGIVRDVAEGKRGPAWLTRLYWALSGAKTTTGWMLALILGAVYALDPALAAQITPAVGTIAGVLIGWGWLDKAWSSSFPPSWVSETLHLLISLGPVASALVAALVSHLSPEWAMRVDVGAGAVALATAWLAARLAEPPSRDPAVSVSPSTLRHIRGWGFVVLALAATGLALPTLAVAQGSIHFERASLPSTGGTVAGNVEIRGATLSAEYLNETDFATHSKWDATGDFDDTGGNCTYTHNTGSGTCAQTSANGAIQWAQIAGDAWFRTVLPFTSTGTAPACTITTAFAAAAQTLNVTTTNTLDFQAKTGTVGSITIACTSAEEGTATLDNASLKRISGDLTVRGDVTAGGSGTFSNGVNTILNTSPNQETTGTAEEVLYTVSLPANTFEKVGDRVKLTLVFLPVNNANSKVLKIRETNIGGTTLALLACNNNSSNACIISVEIVRYAADKLSLGGSMSNGGGVSTAPYGALLTKTFTDAMSFAVTGTTATAAGDVTLIRVTAEKIAAAQVSALEVQLQGSEVAVMSPYQKWMLKQHTVDAFGPGEWVFQSYQAKYANVWKPVGLTGHNDVNAYRNGEYIGVEHGNVTSLTAVWAMDGVPFTPSIHAVYGNTLTLTQTATGYSGGVPVLAARFRLYLAGRDHNPLHTV